MDDLKEINLENIKNIRIWDWPTLDEKIDYIYKTLKAQKRNYKIKLWFKLFILLLLAYLFFFYIPSLPKEKIDELKSKVQTIIKENVSNIVTPMVKDLTKDILKDVSKDTTIPWINWLDLEKVSKEVLDSSWNISSSKVEEFLKKHPELKDKIKANNNF